MKIRTKAPNFALTKELNENTNKSTKFWLKVWQNWALAREYDVDIEKYVSNFVMLIINSPRRLVQFWQNFQTSLVLLIPNCTSNIAWLPIQIHNIYIIYEISNDLFRLQKSLWNQDKDFVNFKNFLR